MPKIKSDTTMRILVFGVIVSSLIACSERPATIISDDIPTKAVNTEAAPSITPLPTKESTPTIEPSPTPSIEEIYQEVPDCIKNDSTDQAVFHELLDKILADMEQQEHLSYSTLYRYLEENQYPKDELSIFIEAHHDKRLEEPGGGQLYFYPMPSHLYEISNINITNLKTNEISNFIITENGFWIKNSSEEPWIYFDGFASGELMNSAELLSPGWINFLLGGGSGLIPGIRTAEPEMVVEEQINGEDVLHRCWLLGEISGEIDGYLIHYESVYTFLEDTEVHLWTAENDSRLVRLVLTAKHNGERLAEEEFEEHDLTREFLLWMDVYLGSFTDMIQVPDTVEYLTIPHQENQPDTENQAPHNEFPLPPGAVISDDGLFASEGSALIIPREYLWSHYESTQSALEKFSGPNWFDIPSDRIATYKVDESLSTVIEFYLHQMKLNGWSIENVLIQPGWSRSFLQFKRGPVSLITILEQLEDGSININGILPPDEEILTAIISGWEAYDVQNSPLSNNSVRGITFDKYGNTWMGSETQDQWSSLSADGTSQETPEVIGGISILGPDGWITYSTENSDLLSDDIWALEADSVGRIWISTDEGLSVFDGNAWTNYPKEEYDLGLIKEIQFDNNENLWAMSWGDGLGKFDGKEWKIYPHLNQIQAFDFDVEGKVIIATGDGLYSLENERWSELETNAESQAALPFDTVADMEIDSENHIWIVSNNGELHEYDGETWSSTFPGDVGLNINYINHLVVDDDGRIWIFPFSGGVYMYDRGKGWTDYSPDPVGIHIYNPNTVEVDEDGRIWIGSRAGVAVFSPPVP